jgi:thiamine kinase-like enzyme
MTWATLAPADLVSLDRLVDELPDRFAALDGCGTEPGLIHGDFHPGNWRGGVGTLVLLDWGDSGVGHPLLDMPAFLGRMPAESASRVRDHWVALLPGDAKRASELIAPIAALRQALIYRSFLDGIEPAEHRYHQADVPQWLREAIRA